MFVDDMAALREVNINLTRALEVLEDVPTSAFVHPEDRLRLQELIARAGGIVASELSRGEGLTLDCRFDAIYSKREEV